MSLHLTHAYQEWPYRKLFRISRGAREVSALFVVHLSDGRHIGRGECGILTHYGESRESLVEAFEAIRPRLDELSTPELLTAAMPAGSARNALDCALWDLACKRSGRSIWELTGIDRPPHLEVDCTIGIDDSESMRADAVRLVEQGFRVLKIKANAEGVVDTVRAIGSVAPGVRLIVDANEAWTLAQLKEVAAPLKELNVVLIEQPLHRDIDRELEGYKSPVPLYADESCATSADLPRLAKLYDGVNIKLDKSGGLTEALALARGARERGMGVMVGCNGATSLGLAPAYVIGALSEPRDLDSAALLFEDRPGGLRYGGGDLFEVAPGFWG
jgi:L-alanine-DL-glutamate epimerase-like enolase superfamily enzyme